MNFLIYKENWVETRERFTAWWKGTNSGRPLMKIIAKREEPVEELEPVKDLKTPEEGHMGVDFTVSCLRNFCRTHKLMAEAFPHVSLNIGPLANAAYLGCEPVFAWETVWYRECVEDWNNFEFRFDENNYWFKRHVDIISRAKEIAGEDFLVCLPDTAENVDVLSVLRGPQALCYDLVDEPDLVKDLLKKVDDFYLKYYDVFYNIVKAKDGSCSYTAFDIWGPGKTAKLQCDFSAMMSPAQFREFVVPSLEKQCRHIDFTMYHLDGPDAIRHVDALMEISELKALQWTAGAGQPDGGSKKWYPIYEKVRAANKSLWIYIYDGEYEDWLKSADKLVKSFGSKGLYLLFPTMTEEQALRLIARAEERWG